MTPATSFRGLRLTPEVDCRGVARKPKRGAASRPPHILKKDKEIMIGKTARSAHRTCPASILPEPSKTRRFAPAMNANKYSIFRARKKIWTFSPKYEKIICRRARSAIDRLCNKRYFEAVQTAKGRIDRPCLKMRSTLLPGDEGGPSSTTARHLTREKYRARYYCVNENTALGGAWHREKPCLPLPPSRDWSRLCACPASRTPKPPHASASNARC